MIFVYFCGIFQMCKEGEAHRVSEADRADICVGGSSILVLASTKGLGACTELDVAFNADDCLIRCLQRFIQNLPDISDS